MIQKFIINNTEELDILLEILEDTLPQQSIQVFKNLIKYLGIFNDSSSQKYIFNVYNSRFKDTYDYISITPSSLAYIEFRVLKNRAIIFINGRLKEYCMICESEEKNKLLDQNMNNLFSEFKMIVDPIL